METDHYTSLAYYRLIENADRREQRMVCLARNSMIRMSWRGFLRNW